MLMRRQFVLTLILMPNTFCIWYAVGTLFAAPADRLTDFLLSNAYPNIVEAARLQGVDDGSHPIWGGRWRYHGRHRCR